MKHLLEYNSFYTEGDVVLIEYWWDDRITKVRLLEKINRSSYLVSHNVDGSLIFNAPNEIIKTKDILKKCNM